tara:strand:+ start:248 stop:553 length:306 start_codon:yes stop_codon:yes gene_type:complete
MAIVYTWIKQVTRTVPGTNNVIAIDGTLEAVDDDRSVKRDCSTGFGEYDAKTLDYWTEEKIHENCEKERATFHWDAEMKEQLEDDDQFIFDDSLVTHPDNR